MKTFILFLLLISIVSCNLKKEQEIVAIVNGEEITSAELSQASKQEIFDLLNMAYEIKMKGLDNLISQKLLDVEAKKNQITTESYLEDYIRRRTFPKEDSVLKKYGLFKPQVIYDKNSLYTIDSLNVEARLQQKNKLRSVLIRELVDSLKETAQINKFIYPPKQPECIVEDLCTHYRGNNKSKITMIIASDYNCERCVEFHKTLNLIYDKYHEDVKFGYINFADAPTLAALACEAASQQNKFWEFHDAILKNGIRTDSTLIFNMAQELGLNMRKFKIDISSSDNFNMIDQNIGTLMKRGLFATPTIIINNRLIYITNSYEELTRLLDIELNNL